MAEQIGIAVELRGITKRFGHVLANDSVNISIREKSIHAIIGENGAGKSTAMNILFGFYSADSGEILIDGTPHQIRNTRDAIQLGIGMVHQHFMLVDTLTVAENIILGSEPGNWISINYEEALKKAQHLSELYGLSIDPAATIAGLSVGERQRVEILRMLFRGARILILDEPTAVLTPQEVTELFSILRNLRDQGKTIILITHKLREVMDLSDHITIMRDGRVVGDMPAAEATQLLLARLLIGRDALQQAQKKEAHPGPPVLSVHNLTLKGTWGRHLLMDISFEVRAGEILAIAGVEGNGQMELIEILAGLIASHSGEISLDGRSLTGLGPRERKKLGICHIPEDRHKRGLLLSFDLLDNSILGLQRDPPIARHSLLDREKIIKRTQRLIAEYDVKPDDVRLPARALSGGNQQKLIAAREFDSNPRLVLAAHPTRGLDIGAAGFIHNKLIEIRDRGAAVLLVSAELDEVVSLGDRIMVMYEGRIAGEVYPETKSEEEIGLMMTGGHQR